MSDDSTAFDALGGEYVFAEVASDKEGPPF
jgi:hypothetical protein